MKIKFLLAFLLAAGIFLCSCQAALKIPMLSTAMEIYSGEQMTASLDPAGEVAKSLTANITVISSFSIDLEEFDTPRTAAALYRDEILSHMLNTNYAKYSGNKETIGNAEKKYPELSITILIPEDDFEAFVYKNFGGERSVVHESDFAFTYLKRVNAYTTASQAGVNQTAVHIKSLYETENTYVMEFYNTRGTDNSAVFRALFIKRKDNTVYLSTIKRIADKRIEAPDEHPAASAN